MILTKQIWQQGKSSRGGYSGEQVKLFGVNMKISGWKYNIIGHDWPEDTIKAFLDLKDAHLSAAKIERIARGEPKQRGGTLPRFVPVFNQITWKEQYLHPNWQKMRNYILSRDNYCCVSCRNISKTLHVHHLKYIKNDYIWNVPHYYLVTLCEDCHSKEHGRDLTAKK